MELDINKNITNEKQQNNEVTDFIKELSAKLKEDEKIISSNTLFNEMLNKVELASKYKNQLQDVINKCLTDMSYERDFFYFDYDKRKNDYCLKYYWNGGSTICDGLTKNDIEELREKGYTFYEPIDDAGTMRESDNLKVWMKYEVDNALLDLELANKSHKGN